MYLICIDTQCPHTRLITNWSEQFTHSQCKPQIQYDQFVITLKDGINRNNTNLINSLESQIAAKFLEFEMDIIKGIQNNLRNLQDQFLDNIQDLFHQIHNYNPIDFTTLKDQIKNSDLLRFCMNVLDNKINYPEHFYLNNSLHTLNREFEKLYFEIQSVFKYQQKVQIPQDEIFAIIAPQVIKEDPSVNIPLKGYKNMQATLYWDIQEDQVDQTIGDGYAINSEELTQFILPQPNNQIKPESIEVNRPKFSHKSKDSHGQKWQKKTKQIQINLLPIFQVLPEIKKFSTEYTSGSIKFSRKGAFSDSEGAVYFEGFLNKTLTYSFLLNYVTKVRKFENYLEFGIIDCGTFTPQAQSKGPPPGVYSINYQGQIKENGITIESTIRMRPGNLFTMKYEGSTSTLSFSFHKDQLNINLQNIKGEICFFALLQKCELAFVI